VLDPGEAAPWGCGSGGMRRWRPPAGVEAAQVVGSGHELPFTLHLGQASQVNWRKPIACLITPKGSSATCLRRL